jgi:hypothetical protein
MLFVMIGMAIIGVVYIFGRFYQIMWVGSQGKDPLPRPTTASQYPRLIPEHLIERR